MTPGPGIQSCPARSGFPPGERPSGFAYNCTLYSSGMAIHVAAVFLVFVVGIPTGSSTSSSTTGTRVDASNMALLPTGLELAYPQRLALNASVD
eukprot:751270-Rhodomonas_salina.1